MTTNVAFNQVFLVDLVSRFQFKYEDVQIQVQVTDRMVDMISERMDVAIRFGKAKDSDFVGTKLFDLKYVLVAGPGYLDKFGYPKRLDDLQNHHCLSLLLDQFHSVWKFRKDGKTESLKIDAKLKVTGALSLIEYAKRGVGLTLLPKSLIERELRSKQLIQVLKSFEATPTEFGSAAWLLYPSKDHLPTRTRVFIDFLRGEFSRFR